MSLVIGTLLISAIIVTSFFRGVLPSEFIFIPDQFLVLSEFELANIFLTQQPINLGSANTTILLVNIFERLYYFFAYKLSLNFLFSYKLLYFVKTFLLIIASYLGFWKISQKYFDYSKKFPIYLISLWYAFNTYSLIFWHGNAFSLTLLLCYALAPLAFFYLYKVLFYTSPLKEKLITLLLLFLMSFSLYLFLVFILFFGIILFFQLIFKQASLVKILKNGLFLVLFFIPLSFLHLLIPYDMLTSHNISTNLTGGETYGMLQGGLLYQTFLWFSWGIYVFWKPRSIYSFHKYFKYAPVILASLTPYFLIFYGLIKKKGTYILYSILIGVILMLFFAKGSQPPLGEVYIYLIENFAPFRIFRSPDNKFGFGVVLGLALLLITSAKALNSKIFVTGLLIAFLFQGYPLLSGIAIRGESTDSFVDRVITFPTDQVELADYLNENSGFFDYVLPFPTSSFTHFQLDSGKYIGQDVLSKLTKSPFFYIVEDGGTFYKTLERLKEILKTNNFKAFGEYPIRYFLVRKDQINYDREKIIKNIEPVASKVFANDSFVLYELFDYAPIIAGEGITYEVISPIKIKIRVTKLSDTTELVFNQSFNANWKLYSATGFFEYSSLFSSELFEETHIAYKEHLNSWTISKEDIINSVDSQEYSVNEDGSLNLDLVLYFKTQSVFYIAALLTISYLILLLFLILFL